MERRTSTALARRLRWVLAALGLVAAYGIAGYMLLEGWPFRDALYMTIETMTTVGFREVRPLDEGGQIFTLSVIVLGVGVALVGISLAAAVLAEAEIGGSTRRRRMDRRIDALRDHFIVCAYGRVGRAAARELEAAGLPFVVVDPKEDLRERMEHDGVTYILDSDATNVYITLTARSINPALFIVARASERGIAERLERAGAKRVVSPYVSSGRHMVRMAKDPSVVDPFEETRSIPIEERVVEAGSALDGEHVAEVGATVLVIRRDGAGTILQPSPDVMLRAGDVILLLEEG
jgi:voltage-gated potassium channel